MNFFKKKASALEVANAPQTVSQVIEEIHETFYTEVDRLLEEAKVSKSLDTDKQELIDKCQRLKSLGFTATKEVKEAQSEIERIHKLKTENEGNKQLVEAINYFQFTYPQYKFITEESVKKICAKYGLVYGEVTRYLGKVPDKNLKQIESFSIRPEDDAYFETRFFYDYDGNERTLSEIIFSETGYKDYQETENSHRRIFYNTTSKRHGKCPLEIAAPISDFNMKGKEIKDYKVSNIPDPVVLKPVYYAGKKHYLIITAWGEEASDPIIVNQINN